MLGRKFNISLLPLLYDFGFDDLGNEVPHLNSQIVNLVKLSFFRGVLNGLDVCKWDPSILEES